MSGNKKILSLFVAGLFLTACQTMVRVPEAYNFKAKEIRNNPYGCWIIVTSAYNPATLMGDSIAGELICMDADTLYVLVNDGCVKPVYSGSISTAELFTHKNQAGTYAKLTSLLLFPNVLGALIYMNEYGAYFLAFGIPAALIGGTLTLIERSSHRNILHYPAKNSLEKMKLYARFPAGKPENIDFRELTLKKTVRY